jgi:hypothetical protein
MKRFALPVLLAVSMIVSAMPNSSASVTPGTKCSKVSSFQQSGKTLLVCDLIKKKKVWRKATAIESKLYKNEQIRIERETKQKILDAAKAESDRLALEAKVKADAEAAQAAAEKAAAEKAAAEKAAAEKAAAEKAAAEKAAAEKAAADASARAAAERAAADAAARAAAEKAAADAAARAAAERAAADAAARAAAERAAATPTVTVLSIFGRPYQDSGSTWYIPITNSSTEALPGYSALQVKYGSVDWTDIGARRTCGTYGCGLIVTGYVDVCPTFRLVARSNGRITTIWEKSPSSGGTCS